MIKIYQIKDIESTKYSFREYKEELFNINDYKVVAETEVKIPEEWKGNPLDYIFMKFNGEACQEFKMHSLSVSDVIEYEGAKYYINNFGFKEIK